MKGLKRIFKWTGIVAGILIVILLAGNAIWVWTTSSRLEAKLAAIREAGDPVTLADLAGEPIPAKDNAAVFLRRARDDLRAIDKELRDVYQSEGYENGRPTESELKTIRSAFEAYPNAILLIEQAAACNGYDPQLDYTVGSDAFLKAYLDHVSDPRTVIRVLHARTILLVADGQRQQAAETCGLMFRLSRHFSREPMLTGYVVSVACRGIAVEVSNQVLQAGPLSADARQALDAELASWDGIKEYQRALKSERAFGLESSRTMPARNFWFVGRALWDDAICYYLDMIDRHFALADRPYSEVAAMNLGAAPDPGGFRTVVQLVLPAILATRVATERNRAQIRSLRVLNALQKHVEQNGAADPKLADLGLPAEATTDPFTGKPLHVKKLPEGWLIYSVGSDLKDDNGKLDDASDIGVGPGGTP